MFLHVVVALATQPNPTIVVAIALLAPILMLTLLIAAATSVALCSGHERGARARLILVDLLGALHRGGRR